MLENRIKKLNHKRNVAALEEARRKGLKNLRGNRISVMPDGTISFMWYSPEIHLLIFRLNKKQAEKMLYDNHLCG